MSPLAREWHLAHQQCTIAHLDYRLASNQHCPVTDLQGAHQSKPCPAAVPPCSCQDAKAAASASADTAAKNGKAGARGRPGNGTADKGGRGLAGRGAKGGKASGIPSAIAPPQLRTAATHVTEKELEQVGEGLLHNTRLATPETGAPTPSY